MTINEKMIDDVKPMTKLLGSASLLIAGIGYVSNFLGFKEGFDDICYTVSFASLLTSLIMYKKLKVLYENSLT